MKLSAAMVRVDLQNASQNKQCFARLWSRRWRGEGEGERKIKESDWGSKKEEEEEGRYGREEEEHGKREGKKKEGGKLVG